MTEINGYRDGTQCSTELMQRAMEESHSVETGDGKKLDWKAEHETWEAGRERVHEEPAKALPVLAETAVGFLGVKSFASKTLLKALPDILAKPVAATSGLVADTASTIGKWSLATAAADGAPVVAGLAGMAAAVAVPVRAMLDGDALKKLSDLDAMDVATTAMLDLDPSFKAADMAKHPGIVPEKVVVFMQTTAFGKEHTPELQAAADAGMRCAFDAIRCGGSAEYMRMHPDVGERCKNDIAFNKGFESTLFAASQHDGAARLDVIKTGLDQRDARSTAHQPIRG